MRKPRKAVERIRYLIENRGLTEQEAEEQEEGEWDAYQDRLFQEGRDKRLDLDIDK